MFASPSDIPKVNFLKSETLDYMYSNQDRIKDGSFIFVNGNDKLYLKMNGRIVGISDFKRLKRRTVCECCGGVLPAVDKFESVVKCEYCGAIQDVDDKIDE